MRLLQKSKKPKGDRSASAPYKYAAGSRVAHGNHGE